MPGKRETRGTRTGYTGGIKWDMPGKWETRGAGAACLGMEADAVQGNGDGIMCGSEEIRDTHYTWHRHALEEGKRLQQTGSTWDVPPAWL